MASTTDIARYQQSLQDEREAIYLYTVLSEVEKDTRLADIFKRMAETEARHASVWEQRIKDAGAPPPAFKPGWRTVVMASLARRFGVGMILPTLTAVETRASTGYDTQPEAVAEGMPADERSHARIFQQLTSGKNIASGGMAGPNIAKFEGRHKAAGGNALRAAVLGAQDGLVSNMSLVMGVAGATMEPATILIAGVSGLIAGAFSMAIGEWVSVQSSRELYAHQLEIERAELEASPEEEEEELALIYEAKGLKPDQARALAKDIISKPESAIDTLAREELSIDPEELGGSAMEAALTSFVLFAIGAIIPIIGFFVATGATGIIISLVMSGLGLFAIGGGITLFTGRNFFFSGMRQMIIGLVAAAATYGIGKIAGVGLGL